jgi:hypothetical protein
MMWLVSAPGVSELTGMVPPIWRDERGRRRPTRPCPRCGSDIPVLRLRIEDVHRVGWQLFEPAQYLECCGYG